MTREALKLALKGITKVPTLNGVLVKRSDVEAAIKEALAQPEQEPVAWVSLEELLVMRGNALGGAKDWRINVGLVKQDGDVGLYTTPPQRTWVGLTDEELPPLAGDNGKYMELQQVRRFYKAIEAKLKEKNT